MKKYICILFQSIFVFPKLLLASNPLDTSINLFGSHFYEERFSSSDKNELFSPYCLFNCLSMAYLGASDTTEEEMAKTLSFSLKQEEIALPLAQLADSLASPGSQYSFAFIAANSLWVDTQAELLPSYENLLVDDFKAYKESVSFTRPAEAADIINGWVKKNTKDTIPHLLGSKDISKNTQLILVSTLYFKGSWVKPFFARATQEEPFYVSEGKTKITKIMHQTESLPYFENEEMQLVLLPFAGRSERGSEMACFVVLPKKFSLENVESFLPDLKLQDWISKASKRKVDLALPKFTLNPRYDLIPTLTKMGMKKSFSSEANFSKMNGKTDLQINKVIHEAFFALDEKGVTASAATAIGVGAMCIHQPIAAPIPFIANRPFMFGIVDLNSNVVLFLGKMVDP